MNENGRGWERRGGREDLETSHLWINS